MEDFLTAEVREFSVCPWASYMPFIVVSRNGAAQGDRAKPLKHGAAQGTKERVKGTIIEAHPSHKPEARRVGHPREEYRSF